MKKYIPKKSVWLICAVLFLAGCCKEKTENYNKRSADCSGYLPCTNIFISTVIKIKQADNSGYVLDSFKTVRKEDGKILNPDLLYVSAESLQEGIYPVFNDNFLDLTDQNGKEFYFIGYKNNIEVVREKYIFSHDCCHMIQEEGIATLVK